MNQKFRAPKNDYEAFLAYIENNDNTIFPKKEEG